MLIGMLYVVFVVEVSNLHLLVFDQWAIDRSGQHLAYWLGQLR